MSKKMDVGTIAQQLQDSAVAGFARSGSTPLPEKEVPTTSPKQAARPSVMPLESPEPGPMGVDTGGEVKNAEKEQSQIYHTTNKEVEKFTSKEVSQ